jgi:death on curing protein
MTASCYYGGNNTVAAKGKNRIPFAPPQAEATAIILALAAGHVSEASLARWIRDRWPAA